MDDVRLTLDRVIRERGEDYAALSRLIGRNPAYIQQFIRRGSPRRLAEADRRTLARYLAMDEKLLGAPEPLGAPLAPAALVPVPPLAVEASAGGPDDFMVAVAKARIGEAAGRAGEIAHQVHGAMGYTREHNLHYSTRRLWSWRDEFGNETHWQVRLGRMIAAQGADALWPRLTGV